ncbi:MAG: AMP-binding protein [Gammaproteobacteria bacterium]|nr:AMP-binding protein [Gammaproteobacteria bacterium]
MQGFFDAIRRTAAGNPEGTALAFHQDDAARTVTWARLWRDVEAAAGGPDAARPGELELIASRTGYDSILAWLAALRNGAHPAYLAPLTPRQDPAVYHAELAQLMARFRPNRVRADTVTGERLHGEPFAPGGEPGFLQFSSGTTGLRKGVFISERQLLAQLAALGTALRITADDRLAGWLPLYHDMGLITSLLMPLYFGLPASFLDPVEWSFRPESLLALVARERATLCWQPDFAFRHIANRFARGDVLPAAPLDSLRLLINCSEPCRSRTFVDFWQRFRAHGLREDALQASYAMAENVFAVTQTRFDGQGDWARDEVFLSSGVPVAGCAVRIAGGSTDQPGEIEVRSDHLFTGYLRYPAPRERLADGWFRTGDLGLIRDGELYVVGRQDDTLIVNGRKILAHQVEDHVGQLPGVRPGRVLCMATGDGAAVDILYEGAELDAAAQRQVRTWCGTAAGVSVNRIRRLEPGTIVKSSSGKIARAKSIAKLARLNLSQ